MNKSDDSTNLTQMGMVLQLICGSLIFGVLTFGAVIGVIVGLQNITNGLRILTLVGIVVAAATYGLAFVVPQIVAKGTIETIQDKLKSSGENVDSSYGYQKLAGVFNTSVILRYALIEGSIFLNLVVFYLEKSSFSLIVAGIGVVLMVVCFPFPGRMVGWIEDRISDATGKFRG